MIQSELLLSVPGIVHGFGTLNEPFPSAVSDRLQSLGGWEKLKPQWKQVHGSQFAEVESPGHVSGDVDALVTEKPLTPIAVVTADCVPVLLAERSGRRVAAIHAGWRGTLDRICEKIPHFTGSRWTAAVGPAIGSCCYEVSQELALQFEEKFADLGPGVAVPKPRYLDLPGINAGVLRRQGVKVEMIRACTKCGKDQDGKPRFHSYRREGGGTRQFSAILRAD
jgi:YfiH family protein